MPLREKAIEMRSAIDGIELAMNGFEPLDQIEARWDQCHDDLEIKVPMRLGAVRQLRLAYDELNRIINSPEYEPANLEL